MKRIIPVLLFAALIAASCEQNGRNEEFVIKGSDIDAGESITTIMATVMDDVIAQAPFADGGFELTLPATLPENALFALATDERTSGASASNPSTQLAFLNLELDRQGSTISFDDSHLNNGLSRSKQAIFIYADRPVTLSGESTWTSTQQIGAAFSPEQVEHTNIFDDIVLKKGWNRVCLSLRIESSEPWEIHTTFSHKSMSDCNWNVYFSITGNNDNNPVLDRWRPQE